MAWASLQLLADSWHLKAMCTKEKKSQAIWEEGCEKGLCTQTQPLCLYRCKSNFFCDLRASNSSKWDNSIIESVSEKREIILHCFFHDYGKGTPVGVWPEVLYHCKLTDSHVAPPSETSKAGSLTVPIHQILQPIQRIKGVFIKP